MTQRDEHLSAERIQAFLDGELSQGEMALVQGHSASCVRCQSEIEAWRVLFDELEDLPTLDPSPTLVAHVMRALPKRAAAGLAAALDPLESPAEHLAPGVLQDLLDGDVDRITAARAHAHLGSCPTCQAELAGWQAVFSKLESLEELAPSYGFSEHVLERVGTPARVGLFARLRNQGVAANAHVTPDRLQALLDGALGGEREMAVQAHVAACTPCHDSLESWRSVFASLETLAELTPSEGFSDRVMAHVRVRAPVPAVRRPLGVRVRAWAGAVVPVDLIAAASSRAAQLMPQSRRAWAFVASLAAAPTVAVAAAAIYLFSNPLLTPGHLASYLWWKASSAVSGAVARAGALGLEATQGLRANALIDAVAGSTEGLMFVGISLTALMGLSLLVVYRNLFAPVVNTRYARITS